MARYRNYCVACGALDIDPDDKQTDEEFDADGTFRGGGISLGKHEDDCFYADQRNCNGVRYVDIWKPIWKMSDPRPITGQKREPKRERWEPLESGLCVP